MDGNHPKRRKDKYNPYSISKDESGRCYLLFKDGQSKKNYFEIEKPLYDLFNRFELEDLSYMNIVDRHIEQSEQTEASLNDRAVQKAETVEEIAICNITNERLHEAISKLPETQRKRLMLYYFSGLTYEQISEMEGCSFQAVAKSILAAEKRLKNLLE